MGKDVIIACDFPNKKETLDFLELFGPERPFVKIGMELFYAEGPDIVRELKARGHKIFLDLKLHDIPNTVERAMERIGALGADMTNVHAAGGSAMMRAALSGLARGAESAAGAEKGKLPLLIAVTQLTSTDEDTMRRELLIERPLADVVLSYAKNAAAAGLAGVVCSPLEAPLVRGACGEHFQSVTPGVRFADAAADDQSRVCTPAQARALGSDYIVVGRPITRAADPLAAYRRCMDEFTKGTEI